MNSEGSERNSNKLAPSPPRLKRGTSVSQETLRDTILHSDSKRGRFEITSLENASTAQNVGIAPQLETIPERSFDGMTLQLNGSVLTFQQQLPSACYETKFVEDVQAATHLRSLLNNLIPLPEVSLHVCISSHASDEETIPSITFTFPAPLEIHCSASLSSPKLALIPCDLETSSDSSQDGKYFHTTSLKGVSTSLSDAVLVLRYSVPCGNIRRCLAAVVCEFEQSQLEGLPRMVLSKLASRCKSVPQLGMQSCIPSKSFRVRKNASHNRLTRTKPNLSLAIPPAQQPNLMKTALTASLKTPLGSSGFHTPQDQRIETPTAPPPLKKEISPYVLRNFCGTPTEPITPSLENTYPATSFLNRLTMGAIAAGTPNVSREEPAALASPMITRPPMLRRSSSLCHTPGGYFRL